MKKKLSESEWLKVIIGANIAFNILAFAGLIIFLSCGADHKGVGQLRVRYKCNIADTWKRETRTVYNPEQWCGREFNKIIRDLTEKCGGSIIIDDQFCGVAQ